MCPRLACSVSRLPMQVVITLAAIALFLAQASAQDYPEKFVRIISPYSPGGVGDTFPRLIAAELTGRLGQQVVVENRPGASQIVGTQLVARSPPDGYTLLFGGVTGLALNVSTYKNLPYDPIKDFAPVALCFTSPMFLFINSRVPAHTVKELIVLAKARPGKITFASGGVGSSNHLAGELFRSLAGVDLVHVPFKGAGAAMVDVLAGQIDMLFTASGIEQLRQGKVRALAVTSSKRSSALPTLPTMQEAGFPGYEATLWWGIVAPANTPRPIITRLSQEIGKVLAQPWLRDRVPVVEITPSTPEEFAAYIQSEISKWRKVIEDARIVLQE